MGAKHSFQDRDQRFWEQILEKLNANNCTSIPVIRLRIIHFDWKSVALDFLQFLHWMFTRVWYSNLNDHQRGLRIVFDWPQGKFINLV